MYSTSRLPNARFTLPEYAENFRSPRERAVAALSALLRNALFEPRDAA